MDSLRLACTAKNDFVMCACLWLLPFVFLCDDNVFVLLFLVLALLLSSGTGVFSSLSFALLSVLALGGEHLAGLFFASVFDLVWVVVFIALL